MAGKTTVLGCGLVGATIARDPAKKKLVTAAVDCGVSPGLSNLLVGYLHAQFDRPTGR